MLAVLSLTPQCQGPGCILCMEDTGLGCWGSTLTTPVSGRLGLEIHFSLQSGVQNFEFQAGHELVQPGKDAPVKPMAIPGLQPSQWEDMAQQGSKIASLSHAAVDGRGRVLGPSPRFDKGTGFFTGGQGPRELTET